MTKKSFHLIECQVTSVDAASVAVEVEAERDLGVDGLVVLHDAVVPEPQNELRQDRPRLNVARKPELVAHPDVDDPISRVDENPPGYDPHAELKEVKNYFSGGQHSTEVAFALPTQPSWRQFSAFTNFFNQKIWFC